jgi:predicted DNA-binding protein with PD1-like motif
LSLDPHRRLRQPGPPHPERWRTAEGLGQRLTFTLEPGLTFLDAVARPLLAAGLEAAALEIRGGALGPFAYVRPALSQDPRYAAYYSETFRPEGSSLIERGNVTFGRRDGAPFLHCHAIWTEPDGARRGGHVLPHETVVAEPIAAIAWGSPAIRIAAEEDAETNFTLFHPAAAPKPGAGDTRLLAARVRPNEPIDAALEAICRAHGIARARLRGSVGSFAGVMFEGGREVTDIATEVLVTDGTVAPGPDGAPRADLTVALADPRGEVHEGRLARGCNPVCITFEVMLEALDEPGTA